MKHKVKLTVIDKKVYPELQRQYCADPQAGACPCYHVGDTFIFERSEKRDDFWHMGLNTLVSTTADPDTTRWPAAPKCRIAPKPGTPLPAISIPACRAVPSCAAGCGRKIP